MIQTLTNFNLLLFNHGELILIFIFPILIYLSIILYLTYFIYSLITKKNKINYIRYISLIKDKDFIFFKDSLFKLYGSILIILSFYLFKHDIWTYILDFNLYLFLSILSLIITSNYFTLVLFKLYTHIKDCVKVLNEINFNSYKIYKMSIFPYYQTRSFSTSTKFNSNEANTKRDLEGAQEAGYFNFSNINNLGSVSQFYDFNPVADKNNEILKLNYLNEKLQDYVNQLPENVKYSVLPVVRSYKTAVGKFKCYPLSYPIKILNGKYVKSWDSSENFIPIVSKKNSLGYKITTDIFEQWSDFDLEKGSVDLFLLGRPWLSLDDLDSESFFDILECDFEFNEILENFLSELSNVHKSSFHRGGQNKINSNNQTRKFSTSTKFHSNDSDFELYPQMESLTKDHIIKDCTSDLDFTQNYLDYKKAKSVEEFKKTYKGGFFGYSDLKHFGNVSQFTQLTGLEHNQFQDNLENKIKDYLNEIPENIIYSVLPVLKWQYSSGDYKSLSISNSIKITRKSDRSLLAETVLHDISETLLNYNIQGLDIELIMMGRPWLKADDFNLDVSDLTLVFDEQLEREISAYSSSSVLDIKKIPDGTAILKNYEYKNIYMDNYGDPIYDKSQNLIGYKIGSNKFASIDTYYNDNNLLCNKVSIKSLSEIDSPTQDEPLISWVDTKTESGFVRYYKKNKYYYDKNNKLINKETSFTCSPFPNHKKDYRFNDKIGTIDFETFGSNVGMGHQHVYAGGWAIKNSVNLFYRKHNETSENFINKIFFSVFSNNHNIDGYTFYVHNLGRFDSIFIIKSLILNKNFFITPIWKDNCIISLSIKFLDKKITLLDSLQLIPGSLDNILKSYDCEVQKGVFPYAFVNINNLFYIGDKPSKKYFPNISDLKYDSIPENNWDLKKETLSYLKADIEGLLEAITKFNINIYNKYSLNITNFKTLPSLALAVYRSSYTPVHLAPELKMIKGELEKEIRSSYFGGNVDVYTNEVTDAYLYDLNSQYSKAMLEDMPIGDPVLSLETDLNKIFGFVYAEITCPDELNLRIPFIQFKDPIGRMTLCPRGKFKRLIFSEEAKYAIKYGYKIKVKYCYQFERGQNLFKDYVNYHYEIKQKKSGDPIQRSIAKLFLNSLYGRLGMKDIEDTIKIVSKREAEDLDKNTNVSILSELTENKFMVRYSGQINDNIRKLYKNDPVINLDKNKNASLNRKELRSSGLIKKKTVPSAVHIAAAISSYARMIINEYKNIPGNPCIMSDTDSAVLSYPLPENLVGTGLGQMKLEHKIKKGIFIRKKLYYILNSENQEIIKASGIDSSRLNYYYFVKLLSGESIEIERTNFNVEWKGLNISVVKSNILVQGLTGNLKTIHNCPDVNFKFISIYKNKRYELIIYSIQEKSIITKPNFINFISIYKPKSYSIILHPLYQLLEYICWLIKLFLFFYSEE